MLEILILIGIYSIYKIIAKIVVTNRCIDMEEVKDLMANRLSTSEKERVTQHLGICRKCQSLIDDFNNDTPNLGEHLIDNN